MRSQIQVLNPAVKEELLNLLNNPKYAPMDKNALRIQNEKKKQDLLERKTQENLAKIEIVSVSSMAESVNSADLEAQKQRLLEAELTKKGEIVLQMIQERKPEFDSEQVEILILGLIQECLENKRDLETIEWVARWENHLKSSNSVTSRARHFLNRKCLSGKKY